MKSLKSVLSVFALLVAVLFSCPAWAQNDLGISFSGYATQNNSDYSDPYTTPSDDISLHFDFTNCYNWRWAYGYSPLANEGLGGEVDLPPKN